MPHSIWRATDVAFFLHAVQCSPVIDIDPPALRCFFPPILGFVFVLNIPLSWLVSSHNCLLLMLPRSLIWGLLSMPCIMSRWCVDTFCMLICDALCRTDVWTHSTCWCVTHYVTLMCGHILHIDVWTHSACWCVDTFYHCVSFGFIFLRQTCVQYVWIASLSSWWLCSHRTEGEAMWQLWWNVTLRAVFVLLLQVKVGADCTDGSSKRSSTELRALWKKAMLETLLLIRMEKENSDIKGMTLTDLFLSSFNFTFLSFFSVFFLGGITPE